MASFRLAVTSIGFLTVDDFKLVTSTSTFCVNEWPDPIASGRPSFGPALNIDAGFKNFAVCVKFGMVAAKS